MTKLVFLPSGGTGLNFDEFDITPRDFLRYAKDDFQSQSEAGLINALSNAKRAIDCQIDTAIRSMGIDSLDLAEHFSTIDRSLKFCSLDLT